MTRSLRQPRSDVQAQIENQRQLGDALAKTFVGSEEAYRDLESQFRSWRERTGLLLERCFATPDEAKAMRNACEISPAAGLLEKRIKTVKAAAQAGVMELGSLLKNLDLYSDSNPSNSMPSDNHRKTSACANPSSKCIFIVHGHDRSNRAELELFLKELGLEPIVLERQANGGMSLIEKFEKYSDVSYAVVLATADDIGYAVAEEGKPDAKRAKEKRARQNVVFELGYFAGRLGRGRTCCLTSGGVQLPTDLAGLVEIRFNNHLEEAKEQIRRELRSAGFSLPG